MIKEILELSVGGGICQFIGVISTLTIMCGGLVASCKGLGNLRLFTIMRGNTNHLDTLGK